MDNQPQSAMTESRLKLITLEVRHGAASVERAWLLSKGANLEHDIARLLEATNATLDLIAKATK